MLGASGGSGVRLAAVGHPADAELRAGPVLPAEGGCAMDQRSALHSSVRKFGPGPGVSLLAAAATAYILATLFGLLALALLVIFPSLGTALTSDLAETALVVMQVVVLVIVVWLGMSRERLHGGIAFLTVASLYVGIGAALALIYSFAGWVAALGSLVLLAFWCSIYGSHGSPWYDPEPTPESLS